MRRCLIEGLFEMIEHLKILLLYCIHDLWDFYEENNNFDHIEYNYVFLEQLLHSDNMLV
ncbi:MAG: hypothetical protein KGD73_06245 [Candidatus Lokiarchaeota archaeon]|nr:hypothetical protein [Candidatus Lokiarchaeota archaeon]